MASLPRGPRVLQAPFRHQLPSTRPLAPHANVSTLKRFSTSAAPQASKQDQSQSPPTPITTPSTHEINAPTSTLPAQIDTPDPLPASTDTPAKLKRLITLGRAYLTFYKTGLKNVFANYRASLPLRKQLGLPPYIPISPPRTAGLSNDPLVSHSQPGLTMARGQFQLVRRSARDMRRMIPFTLILIVCGEFTPLVVPIFGAAITPATCRVPGQIAKERDAASKRKYAALLAHARSVSVSRDDGSVLEIVQVGSESELAVLAQLASPVWAADAGADAVLRACAVFGLVKSHDRVAGSVLAHWIYRPRLLRYLAYLAIDDGMIRAGGGVAALSPAEVRIALDERGAGDVAALRAEEKAEVVEREWLERWLDVREGEVSNQMGRTRIL